MKPCSTCGKPKELSDFHENRTAKDGRQSVCKLCKKKYDKEYRKASRSHIYKRVKKRFLNSPEKRAERAERTRKWREDNPEKAAEHARIKEEKRKNKRKLDNRHD